MDSTKMRIEKAALLHDIGKLVLRGSHEKKSHSAMGVEFLQRYNVGDDILRAVGHHHANDLKGKSFSPDDISYIVYEADNQAASTDRRKEEGVDGGFSSTKCLDSVFNVFAGNNQAKTSFYLKGLAEEDKVLYPKASDSIQASSSSYEKLKQTLEDNLRQKSPEDMSVNELMRVLEATMTFVPSSTAVDEPADISLYDHSKLTAAYAVCMYQYFLENGITDFKKACFTEEVKNTRKQDMYLLVSGDLSGIQQFIYTIPSAGALKSLRGRSFYLEIMLEHLADEILSAGGYGRSCLIYTGGGHFYMLLPNTKKSIELLQQAEKVFNEWMLKHFGTRLYLALGWTPCSAQEFSAESSLGTGAVFQRVSKILSEKKLRRYDRTSLQKLFLPDSEYNALKNGSRECSICHTSATDLQPYHEEEASEACPSCRQLFVFGKAALDNSLFVVCDGTTGDGIELPSLDETESRWLRAMPKEKLEKVTDRIIRVYIKNLMFTGSQMATYLWMGDYVVKEAGSALDFQQLANLSGGGAETSGISRLGVLRADVDNLGAAFIAGFDKKYATLSRTATLSRQLALFFKHYINKLCAGEINGYSETEKKKFILFDKEKDNKRNVHIVYSGGDDVFLVGAWDDLLELAVDIRNAFKQFTNGKLTFSAGLGLFKPKVPVSELARRTGELESCAKANPHKDSIALFGATTEISGRDDIAQAQSFSWEQFIDKVCGEKLKLLKEHFALGGSAVSTKIPLGKSSMYRLMQLLQEGEESINLARFAYVLARMAPDKRNIEASQHYDIVRPQLYSWFKRQSDREELLAALQLVVYNLRDKGDLK